ncbi:Kelch-like protein 8 [Gracilariopsis chorda]|uniref:Kelch-like protein 8 n=1 Tax=Gracilariopsis chorda TaxID=448386 RepID=A0A2V3IUE4_9FLOR|nr:Kelch-like protein 8 [Gracilariopsis chorda]|eukprot:PXF45768.1 Kelch-like protein 8 [Gracilariopsis chorda]
MVNGKGYLLGGRGNNPVKPVDIFDPATNRWTQGARPDIELHHMQCVAYRNEVWIVSSWTGGFPKEKNVANIYIYNTVTNTWSKRPGLPEPRRRGGGAAVLYNNRIYVVGGNRGGHGGHATTLGWMDYYDLGAQKWVTNLKPLPDGRDHVGGSVVNGNKLCIAGGRDGGVGGFFFATKASTYCYTFSTDTWQNMNAAIPAPRAGSSYGTTCAGHLMIAGGERSDAFSQVDVFDGSSWTTTASLQRKRHGSGLAVSDCSCGKIYIASGSGSRGGSPELTTTEVYLPNGDSSRCAVH